MTLANFHQQTILPFFSLHSSLSSCLQSDTISSYGYHKTVIKCCLNLFPDNLHRLNCLYFSYDAHTVRNFNNDAFRAVYKRPILSLYLFSSNISCNLQQQSDSFPSSSQGSDLHRSVPDAVTPFLDMTTWGRLVPACVSTEGKHVPVQFRGKQLKFYVVTSKGRGVVPHSHKVGVLGA